MSKKLSIMLLYGTYVWCSMIPFKNSSMQNQVLLQMYGHKVLSYLSIIAKKYTNDSQETVFAECIDYIHHCRIMANYCLINKQHNACYGPLIKQEYEHIVIKLQKARFFHEVHFSTNFEYYKEEFTKNILLYAKYGELLKFLGYELSMDKPPCKRIMANLVEFFLLYNNNQNGSAKNAFANTSLYNAACTVFAQIIKGFFIRYPQDFFISTQSLCDHRLCIEGITIAYVYKPNLPLQDISSNGYVYKIHKPTINR